MSSGELYQRRPFLWLVIMSLTTKSLPVKVEMGKTIRRTIMDRLIEDVDNNLDILLGLLCFMAW